MGTIRAFAAALLLLAAGGASGQALDLFLKAINLGDTKGATVLLDKGLDPNTADLQGNTALMIASRQGYQPLVALLVERKANVGLRSAHGDTALMFAALKGHLEIVKLLIDHGGAVNQDGWAPLHYAAFENRAEVVKYLILKGAQKDALAPNGYTALMLAARGGHIAAATALLYEDADLGIKGPAGETALGIAIGRKDEEMVKLLKRAGASS